MSKVKEFIPPEVEFADDPMMCELHKIGIKMHEESKNMTDEKWVEYIRKQAKELKESIRTT